MSTLRAVSWAFNLRGLGPIEKLVAIYVAGHAGTVDDDEMSMRLDLRDLAEWCGCSKEEVDIALDALNRCGISRTREVDWVYWLTLNLPPIPEPVPQPSYETKLSIYLIATDRAVKVGITRNLQNRFKGFRTAIPDAFEIVLTASGPASAIVRAEQRSHEALKEHLARGEWFNCSTSHAEEIVRAVLAIDARIVVDEKQK